MVNQMVTDNSRRRTAAAAAATATATQMSTAPDAPKIRRVCTITKRGEPEPAAQSGGTPPRNHRLNRVRTSCFRTPKPKGPKGPSARAAVQTKCKSLSPAFRRDRRLVLPFQWPGESPKLLLPVVEARVALGTTRQCHKRRIVCRVPSNFTRTLQDRL